MKILLFCLAFFHIGALRPCVFQGLVEDPSITQNTFFCPAAGADMPECKNAGDGAIGYQLSQSDILQFFNNQSYWITDQYAKAQDAVGYSETQKATNDWPAMGGYCIMITTNQILADVVMAQVSAKKGQIKVVVQLWYNGNTALELWSQDAVVLEQGQGFKVAVSSAVDSAIATLPAQNQSSFLGQLHLQLNNRGTEYNQAVRSPRSVKIQAESATPSSATSSSATPALIAQG